MTTLTIAIVTVFCVGYLFIAVESLTKVNKAAIALLMFVATWTLLMLSPESYLPTAVGDQMAAVVSETIERHLGSTSATLFFLMGAMTIVELVDQNGGFNFVRNTAVAHRLHDVFPLSHTRQPHHINSDDYDTAQARSQPARPHLLRLVSDYRSKLGRRLLADRRRHHHHALEQGRYNRPRRAERAARAVGGVDGRAGLRAVVLSSIIDNVPLVAGCMGMYPVAPTGDMAVDGIFWQLLAYCAGVGGSMLIIGSAAGVVVMGLEKITFGWYMKHISWIAFVGYVAGIMVYWAEKMFLL